MAISIKDISEIDFPVVAGEGYDPDRVDDFLDEVAKQLGELIRENLTLKKKIEELESARPGVDEESYFTNLKSAIRDSLIGAQRVADDTIASANAKAEEILTAAREEKERADKYAASIKENAQNDLDALKADAEEYRTEFRKLLETHQATLDASEILNKKK